MTAHVHAALMAEYAKDAAETDEPWKRWQVRSSGSHGWHEIADDGPRWIQDCEYRRKPKTIRVPAIELPRPMDTKPKIGDEVWSFFRNTGGMCAGSSFWSDTAGERILLQAGQMFATKDDAQAWADFFNDALKSSL